ncbi:MAG TPA: amidase [Gaiellaceae bacterium]|nr:amidase [Gaiellaceae bacterium]
MSAPEPSAREWLHRLDGGQLSARELVEHVLARCDRANTVVNALVARDDEAALRAADAADAARRRGDRRPLLGLPLTVKDSLETAGLATCSGSWARAAFVPERDATVVARVRAAGAVIIGKTNVPEYTWSYETDNAVFGRTRNPHDPARTCGGSSGGEAALLGADASVAGIGTDGGGSIRVPSHYCGTAGLRPTAGLVPETGCWPPTRDTGMLDMNAVGPMARFVGDLGLLLPVLAGRDDLDPFVQGVPPGDPDEVDVAGLRVGFYEADGVFPVSPETAAAVRRAARALEADGCAVEEAQPPDLLAATDLFFALMAADGGARARSDTAAAGRRHVEQFSRLLEDLRALALDASGLFALVRRMFELRAAVRAFVDGYDVVVCPVAPGPAPPHGCTPGDETPLESYLAFNYTHAFSIAGLPVAVVRVGDSGGLPVGVQVVAGAFRDHVAVAVAAALERDLGGYAPPSRDTAGAPT